MVDKNIITRIQKAMEFYKDIKFAITLAFIETFTKTA